MSISHSFFRSSFGLPLISNVSIWLLTLLISIVYLIHAFYPNAWAILTVHETANLLLSAQ